MSIRLKEFSPEHSAASSKVDDHFAWVRRAIVLLVAIVSLVYFFRQSIFSHFDVITGGNGDNRFLIAILEHWSAVFGGHAAMTSPNFFWPFQGILGYSEAFLLFWPPYVLARVLGCDPFLSFQAGLIVFKTIGFASMFWLLRSCLKTTAATAVLGSVLFTISNLYSVPAAAGHCQLILVTCVPLLVGMICQAWRSEGAKPNRAYANAAASGALLGLLFFSSFYIAWFAVFAGGLTIVIAFAIQSAQARSLAAPLCRSATELRRRKETLAVATLFFALALIPFLVTYLPVMKQTKGRSFEENLLYSARPIEILNVGGKNRIWGHPLNQLFLRITHQPMQGTEAQTGWPPLILCVCLAGTILSLSRRGGNWSARNRLVVGAAGLAFVLCVLLSTKFGDFSLWWLIFKLVPGASAIRVPARLNHVSNILLILAVCLFAEQLRRRAPAVFWVLAVVLVAEQLNRQNIAFIVRKEEKAILSRATKPAHETCRSFFLAKAATPGRLWFQSQLDAMLIARQLNIPTMNGYSGWFPPEWNLQLLDNSYLFHVHEWAMANRQTQDVCGLDLSSGAWSMFDLSATPYVIGSVIDFHASGNGTGYEQEGWSGEETIGSWMVGGKSALELSLSEVPKTDLMLIIRGHAFVTPLHPKFEEVVVVNGRKLADWNISEVPVQKDIILRKALLPTRKVRIEFFNSDPTSPADLRMSGDTRKLGLGMETLQISAQKREAPGEVGKIS